MQSWFATHFVAYTWFFPNKVMYFKKVKTCGNQNITPVNLKLIILFGKYNTTFGWFQSADFPWPVSNKAFSGSTNLGKLHLCRYSLETWRPPYSFLLAFSWSDPSVYYYSVTRFTCILQLLDDKYLV